jgi:hypothetical protein
MPMQDIVAMNGRATFARQSSAAFFTASERCLTERQCGDEIQTIILVPGIVCGALSIELAFKAMLIKAGGRVSGHKLSELFQKLEPRLQNEIIQAVGLDHDTFAYELTKMSNAFVQWRYIYEYPEVNLNLGFMEQLSRATQNTEDNAVNT